MKVKCKECGRTFEFEKKDVHEERGIDQSHRPYVKWYIACPNSECGKTTTLATWLSEENDPLK